MARPNPTISRAFGDNTSPNNLGAAPDPATWVALDVNSIRIGKRLREVDPSAVANLQVSIQETGFFGSILVRPITDGDELGPQYRLVAGAHRLAAIKALCRTKIPATIRLLSDDEALQIEIDENLVRRGLNPLERAEMVAARFGVWARRFPDRVAKDGEVAAPKRGRPKNSEKFSQLQGGAPDAMGFAAETAADVGLNKRTIEYAWTIVSRLPQTTRDQLRGTWIASNEGVLRQLAALGDADAQAGAIGVLLAGQTKNVLDARALAEGREPVKPAQTPVDVAVKAFRKLWGDASPSARMAILHELAGKKLPDGWTVTGGAA